MKETVTKELWEKETICEISALFKFLNEVISKYFLDSLLQTLILILNKYKLHIHLNTHF